MLSKSMYYKKIVMVYLIFQIMANFVLLLMI